LDVSLHEMAANKESVKSLTCWPWINVIMNSK
jgi:hypothetical protein